MSSYLMTWIVRAQHDGEYRLRLVFNDGRTGVVDLRELAFNDSRQIVRDLQDPTLFQRFHVDLDTVVWENGFDLAPESLYEKALITMV